MLESERRGFIARELRQVVRVPYLVSFSSHEDLFHFVDEFTAHVVEETQRPIKNTGKRFEYNPQVLLIVGLPGSGKSHYKRLIEEFMPFYYQYCSGDMINMAQLNWETHGEKSARRLGLVQTSSNLPFSLEELRASNDQLAAATVRELRKSWLISAEVPAVSAAQIGGLWMGRPLGTKFLYDLALREGQFADEKYDLYVAAFEGGPVLRHIFVYFRDAIRESAGDLQEAGKFAYMYGKIKTRRSLTQEEYKQFSTGASPYQIEVIEKQVDMLRSELKRRGLADFPQFSLFNMSIPPQFAQIISEEELEKSYNIWSYGAVINYILLEHLCLNPSRVFIGYNDPQILSFPDWDLLVEDIKMRKEKVRLLMKG